MFSDAHRHWYIFAFDIFILGYISAVWPEVGRNVVIIQIYQMCQC